MIRRVRRLAAVLEHELARVVQRAVWARHEPVRVADQVLCDTCWPAEWPCRPVLVATGWWDETRARKAAAR